jgi:hypothetical protein
VNRVRPPVVVGLTASAGTSTLAAALHAGDGGRFEGWAACAADVVVCPAAHASLRHAATLACAPPGPRPLLAITLGAAEDGQDEHTAVALRAVQPRFGAVVVLPHIARWHGLADSRDDAAGVLAQPPERLAPPLRAYAAALRALVAAVVGSGLLNAPVPPLLTRPRTEPLRPAPVRVGRPVVRSVPFRPVPVAAPHPVVPVPVPLVATEPEPDDEALEAEPVRASVAAGRAG